MASFYALQQICRQTPVRAFSSAYPECAGRLSATQIIFWRAAVIDANNTHGDKHLARIKIFQVIVACCRNATRAAMHSIACRAAAFAQAQLAQSSKLDILLA